MEEAHPFLEYPELELSTNLADLRLPSLRKIFLAPSREQRKPVLRGESQFDNLIRLVWSGFPLPLAQ